MREVFVVTDSSFCIIRCVELYDASAAGAPIRLVLDFGTLHLANSGKELN